MTNILSQKIGIAGCGSMGFPMLQALIRKNLEVTGYDVKAKSCFELLGNKFVEDKKGFINSSEVIISVVRDSSETDELCMGKNGIFESADPITLIICSTVSPNYLKKLAKQSPHNISIIDAPMSGAPIKAREGSLTFMVGTDGNTFRLVKPLLEIMGRDIIYLGEFGKGMAGKVLNNFVAACSVVAVRHVLAESNGFGLNPEALVKVLNASSGKTWFSEGLFDIEWAQEEYSKSNTIGILEKDVHSYLDGYVYSKTNKHLWKKNLHDAILDGLKNIPKIPGMN